MLKRRLRQLRDVQRGATMIEVLVSLSTGLVVLSGLTMVIVVSLHGSNRVAARTDANQQARLVMTKVMNQLHSACVAPKIAPILAGSHANLLRFVYAPPAEAGAVAPLPILTELSYADGALTQIDRPATGGVAPSWTYSATTTSRVLLEGVGPIAPATGLFSYFAGNNGATAPVAQATPLSAATAALTVQVKVALSAEPSRERVDDRNSAAAIRNGATLRLTPPSFNQAADALPCQ